jgi:hypothetical protein
MNNKSDPGGKNTIPEYERVGSSAIILNNNPYLKIMNGDDA